MSKRQEIKLLFELIRSQVGGGDPNSPSYGPAIEKLDALTKSFLYVHIVDYLAFMAENEILEEQKVFFNNLLPHFNAEANIANKAWNFIYES